jgi:hypothetical protein
MLNCLIYEEDRMAEKEIVKDHPLNRAYRRKMLTKINNPPLEDAV